MKHLLCLLFDHEWELVDAHIKLAGYDVRVEMCARCGTYKDDWEVIARDLGVKTKDNPPSTSMTHLAHSREE